MVTSSFPINRIHSIRNPETQQHEIGIPTAYLNKHAYHKIVIQDGNDEVTIETKVLGHESYARGVEKIITAIVTQSLENKRQTVLDLINQGIIL